MDEVWYGSLIAWADEVSASAVSRPVGRLDVASGIHGICSSVRGDFRGMTVAVQTEEESLSGKGQVLEPGL